MFDRPFAFFAFRRIGMFTPLLQICVICLLYITTTIFAFVDFQKHGTMFGYPLSVSILFVPIYEEMIFRGMILKLLEKHTTTTQAVIGTSILFALWHLKNIFFLTPAALVYQMIYAGVVVSPILSYITCKTRSIWPGVILHYINNLASPLSWMLLGMIGLHQ